MPLFAPRPLWSDLRAFPRKKEGRCQQTGRLTVQAGSVAAAVQLLLTVGARVARRAAAGVASGRGLHTGAAVEARAVRARHGNDLAVLSVKALRAGAGVVVLQVLLKRSKRPNVAFIWPVHVGHLSSVF